MSIRTWRRGALTIGVVAIVVASIVQAARSRCQWGSFAYMVPVENPTSQEDWRKDVAVLIEGEERIVTDDHHAIDAALSPDGDRVVVAKGRGPTDDEYAGVDLVGLFVYEVDGSSGQRLTGEPGGSQPDWSPDGEMIVFISGRGISTVDVDDREAREIFRLPPSNAPDPDYLIDVAWSGDSSRVAYFIGHQSAGDSTLWTMRADGSGRRRVLRTGEVAGDVAWSPNGDGFAWSGWYQGISSVLIAFGTGGDPEQVEPNSQTPVWSRDGSQLAYVIGHEGHHRSRIVVGDAHGSAERPVPLPHGGARGGTSLIDWASC